MVVALVAACRDGHLGFPVNNLSRGYLLGITGVAVFSLTLPLTRIAVADLDPLFLSLGRAVLAAAIAGPVLLLTQQAWPTRQDLKTLCIIALGVVFGFPVLSAIAMQTVPASHGGVVAGALPLATALMATVFAGERPSPVFWFWSFAGSAAVVVFALWDNGFTLHGGDLALLAAVVAAAAGYAAGGSLSRKLGGWQVISWALVLALPVTLPAAIILFPAEPLAVPANAWLCFLYVALMSQFIGFFFWNQGLALGGVAKVGQVQLLQTFLTLAAAALINGEPLSMFTVGFAVLVGICVWFGRKAKVG